MFIKLKLVIGVISVLIVIFSSFIVIDDYYYIFNYKKNIDKGNRLVIPKIEFDMNIYDSSLYNNVDSNIEMLDSSDKGKNLYFFAGHSGGGDNCYFNRVKELVYGDIIYIYMDGYVYSYKVVDSYNIKKSGFMEVMNDSYDLVYLITCNDFGGQLVVKGMLIKIN